MRNQRWGTVLGLTFALGLTACGGAKEAKAQQIDPGSSPPGSDSGDVNIPEDAVNPNLVLEQCLLDRGYTPGHAGETDGEPGLDLSSLDQTDPAVVEAIESCRAEADGAAALGDGSELRIDDDAAKAELEAYISAFYACMEDKGFHPYSADDPQIEFSGNGGVLTRYPAGETDEPAFPEARAECDAAANNSTRDRGGQ